MIALYPSLIAANQLLLKETVELLEPYCQGFHCDIMDNHFVPNLTWGPLVVNAIAQATNKPLWVHLMIDKPDAMLEKLELKPLSTVSFHIESIVDNKSIIARIKEKKWRTSVAINPKTAPQATFSFLPVVDQVLVMSVEPGASGQCFIQDSLAKIESLAFYREQHGLSFTIGVDGGIGYNTIASVIAAGGQELVLGTAIFAHKDPVVALATLRALGT